MLPKLAALAGAIVALCTSSAAPVAAQRANCTDMYDRVIALYQAAPQSPEYSQTAAAYRASCLEGMPTPARAWPRFSPWR
jgi:hypothetical protein